MDKQIEANIRLAFAEAVRAAIQELGLERLKQTSFFASQQAAEDLKDKLAA